MIQQWYTHRCPTALLDGHLADPGIKQCIRDEDWFSLLDNLVRKARSLPYLSSIRLQGLIKSCTHPCLGVEFITAFIIKQDSVFIPVKYLQSCLQDAVQYFV